MILGEKFHVSHPQGLKVNAGNVFNPRVVIGKFNLTIASGLVTQLFFYLAWQLKGSQGVAWGGEEEGGLSFRLIDLLTADGLYFLTSSSLF